MLEYFPYYQLAYPIYANFSIESNSQRQDLAPDILKKYGIKLLVVNEVNKGNSNEQ